jgi:hypothetical protein
MDLARAEYVNRAQQNRGWIDCQISTPPSSNKPRGTGGEKQSLDLIAGENKTLKNPSRQVRVSYHRRNQSLSADGFSSVPRRERRWTATMVMDESLRLRGGSADCVQGRSLGTGMRKGQQWGGDGPVNPRAHLETKRPNSRPSPKLGRPM